MLPATGSRHRLHRRLCIATTAPDFTTRTAYPLPWWLLPPLPPLPSPKVLASTLSKSCWFVHVYTLSKEITRRSAPRGPNKIRYLKLPTTLLYFVAFTIESGFPGSNLMCCLYLLDCNLSSHKFPQSFQHICTLINSDFT